MSSVQTPLLPALETFRYTDVDQFTKALRKFEVHFTPLARRISVRQTILNVPEFDIAVAGTFHRLVDMQLADDCTSVCFSPDRSGGVRFNGLELDRLCIGIGHGGDGFSMVEQPGGQLAGVVFAPEVRDRGWPETRGHFAAYLMTPMAQAKLAILTAEVLDFAITSPGALRSADTRIAIKESMLAAVDQAFQPANIFRPMHARQLGKNFRIFKRVEDAIAQDLRGPIYSEALAQTVGISIRMLQDVVEVLHAGEDRLCIVCPLDHPFAKKRRITLESLAGYPLVLTAAGTSVRAVVDAAFEQAGVAPVLTCEPMYMMTAVAMVRAGLGLTILPGSAREILAERSVVARAIDDPRFVRPIALVKKRGRTLPPITEAFVAVIASAVEGTRKGKGR